MSVEREFSIHRRRAGIVDLLTPVRAGTANYTLEWAQNFDGVFAPIITQATGYFDDDPGVNRAALDQAPGRNHRFVFNPTTFGINDASAFWLRLIQNDAGGAPIATSPPVLVLPESARHTRNRVAIAGNAPNAATIAGSLRLYLPFGANNLFLTNEDIANSLFLAFSATGPEMRLRPGNVPEFAEDGVIEQMLVRGDGAIVRFSAHFIGP